MSFSQVTFDDNISYLDFHSNGIIFSEADPSWESSVDNQTSEIHLSLQNVKRDTVHAMRSVHSRGIKK